MNGRDYVDPRLLKRIDDQAEREGVDLLTVPVGARIGVRTRNSTYTLLKSAGRWMIQGGKRWIVPTAVNIAGSTFGGSTIMANHIGVSMYMEIWEGSKCVVTSAVESIKVE